MLFPGARLDGIRNGTVTVAFRSWRRPTVRPGGTLQSPAGLLAIDAVDVVGRHEVTEADARAAGATSAAEVLAGLPDDDGRILHRIRFRRLGDDPRVALRQDAELDEADRTELDRRLARLDAAADHPWTRAVLEAIDARPGVVSSDLAAGLGIDRDRCKRRVRRLKDLGLTESLEVGYRLSPRGRAYLRPPATF